MDRDPRTLRLHDIQPQDVLTAQCPCGHIGRFAEGDLQRRFHVPSDTLIADLQYRMRVVNAGATRASASSYGRVSR